MEKSNSSNICKQELNSSSDSTMRLFRCEVNCQMSSIGEAFLLLNKKKFQLWSHIDSGVNPDCFIYDLHD